MNEPTIHEGEIVEVKDGDRKNVAIVIATFNWLMDCKEKFALLQKLVLNTEKSAIFFVFPKEDEDHMIKSVNMVKKNIRQFLK